MNSTAPAAASAYFRARLEFGPYIEIHLDNLLRNLAQIKRSAPDLGVIPVVKDCAYGHGATAVMRTLESVGIDYCAVAQTEEARALRAAGIRATIIVMGESSADDVAWGSLNNVEFEINDLSCLARWNTAGCRVISHCNVDTGMSRLGILPDELPELIRSLNRFPSITCKGLCTHFACADQPQTPSVAIQHGRLMSALQILKDAGIQPSIVHCQNSAGAIRFKLDGITHFRPGIALYGCSPDPAQDFGLALLPVAQLKAPIIKIKRVPAQTPVSYGSLYTTTTQTSIATIAAGYAHGVPRLLTGRGEVLAGQKRYPIAGRVTMDYIMIDLGPSPAVRVGDEVVIFGTQSTARIDTDEVARHSQTIAYEVLCGLSAKVDRFIIKNGAVVDTVLGHYF